MEGTEEELISLVHGNVWEVNINKKDLYSKLKNVTVSSSYEKGNEHIKRFNKATILKVEPDRNYRYKVTIVNNSVDSMTYSIKTIAMLDKNYFIRRSRWLKDL